MQRTRTFAQVTLLVAMGSAAIFAQEAKPPDVKPVPQGIAISDALTIAKCGGCHQRDSSGMMRRLSYIRTTPEVWEEAIKRMVRLNGLSIKPEDARAILRYLSANNGLSPEEAKPIFWEAEHRMFRDESDKVPADALQHTCNYCHTIGRVLGQRRTKEDYDKLIAMHVGLFPGAENTLRPRRPHGAVEEVPITVVSTNGGGGYGAVLTGTPGAANGTRVDGKYPSDIAVEYLTKAQPLITASWTNWKAAMPTPKLEGKWMLIGHQAGKGRVFGTLTIEAGANPDEFITKTEIEYATSGIKLSRTGKGLVYTGYSWRGRSDMGSSSSETVNPAINPKEWREALIVSRDGASMEGRWFWGGYEEFGIDARLTKVATAPMLAGTNAYSLKSPSDSEIKIYGANFSPDMKAADLNLGAGVSVKKIVSKSATSATLEIEVKPGVASGMHDIAMGRSTVDKTIAIYDKVAYIKVMPDASMARLGGTIAAKQYAQFEAVAFAKGADGKAQTADDIALGPVTAAWGMEEFVSTPDDDDVKFVGEIDDAGLFTPNLEGPNPARQKQANNYPTNNWGDVWIDATYDVDGTPMKARSYLVVTIPVYMRYDQPEVGQ